MSDVLIRIKKLFIEGLPARASNLDAAMLALEQPSPADSEEVLNSLSQLRQELHKLAGTAGSVGYPEITEAARVLYSNLAKGSANWCQQPSDASLMEIKAKFCILRSEVEKSLQ